MWNRWDFFFCSRYLTSSRCSLIASNIFIRGFHFLLKHSVQEEEIMATLLGTESHYTGGKRRNGNSNIVTKFAATKITGKGFSRGTQVRETVLISSVKRVGMFGRSRPGTCAAGRTGHEDASPGTAAQSSSLPPAVAPSAELTATLRRVPTQRPAAQNTVRFVSTTCTLRADIKKKTKTKHSVSA